jgi:hypothetical protein
MTVDTIFLCFCIDCQENDGMSSPYYMSDGLKKVMSDLKAEAGGVFNFGNNYSGIEGGQPMIPSQPSYQQVYPQQPPYPKN